MSIRIHVIRTHYPHWGRYSGINQYLRYMDPSHFKIDVRLAADSDEDFPIKSRILRNCLRFFVQQRGMEWYKLSDLMAEIDAFGRCRRHPVDIIHYLDGEHSAQFLPGVIKKLRKARPKLVATYHQPSEIIGSLIVKKTVRRLDAVIVVSPEQISYFSEFVGLEKIRLILHGIDVDYFVPSDAHQQNDRFRCITVGHYLRDFKTVRTIAQKLMSRRDIEFHVVSSQAGELKDLANVTVHIGVGDADLLKLYRQSDILLLPLLQSTANNSLLEAIACGLPVLSTALPSVRAYVPGEEAILIENNDPGRFADAILHLAQKPEDRKKMGREARKRAEQLDWHNIARQYEALYSELAEENC
jgi:glycosyltransferase involved in cell wall biosynthesis